MATDGRCAMRAGIDTYALYGEETTYATVASTIQSIFGVIQSVNASPKRNLVKVRGINGVLPTANTTSTSRDAIDILRGKFEGSMSVSFQALDFAFLKYVMGTSSGTGTAIDLINYPQATASTTADKLNYLQVPSITISTNYYFGGTGDYADKAWQYSGGKINSCTIKGNIGEPISIDLDIPFAKVTGDATLDTAQAMGSQEVYHFTGFALEYPTGSAVDDIVESFELSITNNIEILYGLGSDTGKCAIEKERDFELKLTLNQNGTQYFDDFMGGATTIAAPTEIASIKITLTGDTNRQLVATCLRCKIEEAPQNNDYPNVIKESLTIVPQVVYFTEQTQA